MDAEFAGMFRDRQGAAFLVFHPAWAYFARSYGLVEVAIETDGKEPKAADLANIISEAKERGVKAIFISPQFSRRSAEIVAQAVGASVTTADPLAAEWEENLRAVSEGDSGGGEVTVLSFRIRTAGGGLGFPSGCAYSGLFAN